MVAGLFPHPLLSWLLGVAWLLLAGSVAPVHWLAALAIGWAVPRLVRAFLGPANRIAWGPALGLTLRVLWDIVVANVAVARLVLGPTQRLRPAWLRVPLASRHPLVNSLLASIVTTTPGTVSAVVDEQRGVLWVHALDCPDAAAAVREIQQRYEGPLLRIFGVTPARDGGD
ncbi:MAG: Na+/H+ antiporter subunit E [Pseudomonadota bacterium]